MESLKDSNRAIQTSFLYALAIKAIPNLTLQRIASPMYTRHKKCLILLCCFYACARKITNLSSFVTTMCSVFSALRTLIWVPAIPSDITVGDILFRFTNNIANGQYPHAAILSATKHVDLAKLIFIDETNVSSYSKSKSDYSPPHQSNSNESSRDLWTSRDSRPPRTFNEHRSKYGGICKGCKQRVFVAWKLHNRDCPAKRTSPRRY